MGGWGGGVARQQHFKLLDLVDEELLGAPGQQVLCFLVAPEALAFYFIIIIFF